MVKIGVIGYGYWGPNIVRNFNATEGSKVAAVCDKNPATLKRVTKFYPDTKCVTSPDDIIASPQIDAIAVVTPVSTHFDLAKRALENGKHVFVEKPFTSTVAQAEELVNLADKKGLTLMVDHTFLFTGAVKKMKELIDQDVLGAIYYYDSTRINLGLFQHDVNVIWDLAPHDFSIMDYLIREKPVAVVACGKSHFYNMEDVAYITVYFTGKMIAHFNVNWISPVKVRNTLIGGEKKMLVWNDVDPDEKIRVYDKGVEVKNRERIYNLLVSYRSSDMYVPKLEQVEALASEVKYFLDCMAHKKTPINDGRAGLQVVKMLEACDLSLRKTEKLVNL
jgi:predicted dehydrogenase